MATSTTVQDGKPPLREKGSAYSHPTDLQNAQSLCANIAETFTSLLITVEGGEVLHYGSSNY